MVMPMRNLKEYSDHYSKPKYLEFCDNIVMMNRLQLMLRIMQLLILM